MPPADRFLIFSTRSPGEAWQMILLSSEGKGLVKISSWQELIERPGYVAEIDSSTVRLEKIICEYSLPAKPKCGLKGWFLLASNLEFLRSHKHLI